MLAVATQEDLRPENRPYQPYGAAERLLYSRDKEIVLSGPAGTGKSRAALEKLHLCALKYPGMRGLMLRETRASLTESGLVTYEEKVLPFNSPIAQGIQRRMRQAYHYPNKSELVVAGLDDVAKVMSTEYDMIYIQELIEVGLQTYEALLTRLRNGVMPYQQLISDTNPDSDLHWVMQRANNGLLTMFESRHEDNPVLYNHAKGEWTEQGLEYISTLKRLSGVRYDRLFLGKWVSAEGAVYETFDRKIHVIDRFEPPKEWTRYWAIDFGYTNPFVWQLWVEDPDGRLILYKEIYMTQRTVKDHCIKIREAITGEPLPRAVLCDHDAEGRATLEAELGVTTLPAHKAVTEGIQAVQERLKLARDGKPRTYIMRDAIIERDTSLVERLLPACTLEEIPGYVWDTTNSRKKGEEPVKANDHGMDAWRYIIIYKDPPKNSKFRTAVGGTRPTLQPGIVLPNPAPPIMPGMPNRGLPQPPQRGPHPYTPPGYRRVG